MTKHIVVPPLAPVHAMEGQERMRLRTTGKLRLYLVAVATTAAASLLVLAPQAATAMRSASALTWWLAAGVVAAAVASRGLQRTGAESVEMDGVGLALPCAFALLLSAGTGAAAVCLAVGMAVSVALRPAGRALADLAVPIVSLVAAGAVITLIAGHTTILAEPAASGVEVVAIGVAGAVLFAVHMTLTAVAVALTQRIAVADFVVRQLLTHVSTGTILLSVAPIVLVVATKTPSLLALLALPVLALYRHSRAVLATEHLALHDSLTGLPNRRLFLERLALALREARLGGHQVGVLLIDLDRFKEVNDRLGHHVGDLLLQAIGPALAAEVGPDVTVARMGGDEFALCVPDVDGADEAVRVAKRIIGRLTMPFAVESFTIDIGASIGIALCPAHADDVSTAMQRADIAMYVAKETRGGYEVYSEERDPHRRQRITSPSDLRHAAELGQLLIHYQPKAEIRTGEVRGVEALVRWNHPLLGLVGPAEFIPLAERAGLIGPITAFVLERSLQQCRGWADQGLALRLAVNLSVQSLYDEAFPGLVADLLDRFDTRPEDLVLDVTESTVMADPRRAQRVLGELGAMGVTLAIDDFGTGYSSLAYLKQLPVSELKIDSSFVLGMAQDGDDAIIVHSTIDLGQKFGLEVVAEGVESRRVWDLLGRLGCNLAQGSYICPPLPAESLSPWLLRRAHSEHDWVPAS